MNDQTPYQASSNGKRPQSQGATAAAAQPNASRGTMLEVAWRGRWLILASAILGLGIAFALLQYATPMYQSSSRILIEQSGPRIFQESLFTGNSQNYLNTQASLIQSSPILSKAAQRIEVLQLKTFKDADGIGGVLSEGLGVGVSPNSDIVSVSFESPYPEEAALVANFVVDAYIEHHIASKQTTASEVLAILTREKAKRDNELKLLQEELTRFRKISPALATEALQGEGTIKRFESLSSEYTRIELQLIDAKVNYENALALSKDPTRHSDLLQAAYNSGVVQGDRFLNQQISTAEGNLAKLQRSYPDDHKLVNEARETVDNLYRKQVAEMDRAMQTYVSALANEFEVLDGKAKELRKRLDTEQAQHAQVSNLLIEYRAMQDNIARSERLSDILDDRIKELTVTENVGAMNVTVLDVAGPAGMPFSPKRSSFLGQGLMLGLLVGFGLAYLRHLLDLRIRSSDEACSLMQSTLLGVVPSVNRKLDEPAKAKVVDSEPKSEIAEAYRTIRTGIYFGMDESQTKTILITSPSPGDGKSTTACNMAIAMAQAGRRVLLLDADFRKPSVHKYFGLERGIGLTDFMIGEVKMSQALVASEIEGLTLLPCGSIPPNPSEILNSDRFQKMLSMLTEKYDHVIIDSPPVMAVTDARILGAVCDYTVLVLRAEKSTRKSASEAAEGLRRVGANLLGFIMNDIPANRRSYSYQRYGYQAYGYYGIAEKAKKKQVDQPADTKREALVEQS